MKRFLALVVLVVAGVATWQIGSKLSADAIGMGVGILFGVMAGIPTALLLLASQRRTAVERAGRLDTPEPRYPQQPPVIVLTGGQGQAPPAYTPYGGRQGYAPALPDSYECEQWPQRGRIVRYEDPSRPGRIVDQQAYYDEVEYRRLDRDTEW